MVNPIASSTRRLAALILLSCLGATGCEQSADPPAGKRVIKVAYVGLTCEAPLFVAYKQGFFKEEGLDAELVATDWDGLREGLGMGRFDISQTLIMYLVKPIVEQSLDVKITGGIHTGCLRVQTAVASPLKKVEELKGKTIAVPTHLGSPPHMFCARVLRDHGIDPRPEKGEVKWIFVPPDMLGKSLAEGKCDAIATSDPIGTILLGAGKVRTMADQAVDPPYCDEYCCAAVVSGKLARENPQLAAKATRALLKAAKWTYKNPAAAAKISVENKYTAASLDINAQALSKLKYQPAVARCKTSVDAAAHEMQKVGLLKDNFDAGLAVTRAWTDLDTVSDSWIDTVQVGLVPGGGVPPPLPQSTYLALCKDRAFPRTCCAH
jgi:NitT/TauT family transport system substrate-binding protein